VLIWVKPIDAADLASDWQRPARCNVDVCQRTLSSRYFNVSIERQAGTSAMERSDDIWFTASVAWLCTSVLGACAVFVLG
jgi:hypothetical protein